MSELFAVLLVLYGSLQGEIEVLFYNILVFELGSRVGLQSVFAAPLGYLCSLQGEI